MGASRSTRAGQVLTTKHNGQPQVCVQLTGRSQSGNLGRCRGCAVGEGRVEVRPLLGKRKWHRRAWALLVGGGHNRSRASTTERMGGSRSQMDTRWKGRGSQGRCRSEGRNLAGGETATGSGVVRCEFTGGGGYGVSAVGTGFGSRK